MAYMQELTWKKVQAAARKAYREKRLTAQDRNTEHSECVYQGHRGRVCAIGAALTVRTRKNILSCRGLNSQAVDALLENGIISIPLFVDLCRIRQLQQIYDAWASRVHEAGHSSARTRNVKKVFVAGLLKGGIQ